MSEKEKKARDILVNEIADILVGEYCTHCKICENKDIECRYIKAIDIIDELIEKQQKEIEENQILIDDIKDHRIVYIDTPEFEEKFISKDKIKEKIEHYNNELEHIKNGEEFENEKPMYYWGKVALESLLEEN